jgi:hypothetical protein
MHTNEPLQTIQLDEALDYDALWKEVVKQTRSGDKSHREPRDWSGFLKKERRIGMGGVGEVILATWINLPPSVSRTPSAVAVKITHPGFQRAVKVWLPSKARFG